MGFWGVRLFMKDMGLGFRVYEIYEFRVRVYEGYGFRV